MASFQKLPLTFLLLIVLGDIQAESGCLSCSEHNITELGKGIIIKCKNNGPILSIGMTFCTTRGNNCSIKGVINEQKRNLTVGETTLEIQNSVVFLNINQVKISHEGNYRLTYVTEECMNQLTISLEVFAPYTSPQVIKRNDTLVCTASGGYPEEKLYWVSKAGTNLTHNSTYESVKNEDGSFSLSNTLQLESPLSEAEYCCTFNKTRVPSRQPASACMTLESVTTSMSKTEETTLEKNRIPFIMIPFILLAFVFFAVLYRRRKKDASWARRISIVVGRKDVLIRLN
ncbi:uncharacterized protein LOC134489956 [Candoia aspera]|uniref:uncharacterized protein LOC134489956 n=1 Tax=Candoia aspera TaxID=51853 RepID=UPI002FD809B6